MRSNIDGAILQDNLLLGENRFGVATQTLTGTYAIPPGSEHIQVLDANGVARNVTLPASPQKGDWFLVYNPAAGLFALTLQDSAGAALSPAVTVAQAKAVMVFWTGTAWKALVGA